MSEPQVFSMEQIDRIENGTFFPVDTQGCLIATVRAKEAALGELAGIYDLQYGALNQQLRDQLNEAVAVIESLVATQHESKLDLWVAVDEAKRFLAKHQDSPTRANDQTTSG